MVLTGPLVVLLAIFPLGSFGVPRAETWVCAPVPSKEDERQAVAELKKLGVEITREGSEADSLVVGVRITAVTVEERMACLRHLKHLPSLRNLDTQYGMGDDELRIVGDLTQLRELGYVGKATDVGMQHLRGLTKLEKLILGGDKISDEGIAVLKTMPDMEVLQMRCTNMTDAGLKNIANLRKLRVLDLYTAPVTNDGMKLVGKLADLHELTLSGTKVDTVGVKQLDGLKQLEVLRAFGNNERF
jgi:hypothetical protein